jgi:hypothetical protein
MYPEEIDLPVACVTCPLCKRDLSVDPGESAIETMWQHEYECAEIYIGRMVTAA